MADGTALLQTALLENTYSAKAGEGEIKVKKQLTGRAWTAEDSFGFTIAPKSALDPEGNDIAGGAPMPKDAEGNEVAAVAVTKDSAGYTESFGKVSFTEPGTYQWTVTEAHAGEAIDGVNYASAPETVTIKVKDDGKGNLVADGTALLQTALLENIYNADAVINLSANKTLNSAAPEEGAYRFTLSGFKANDQPVANDGTGKVTFAPIAISSSDLSFTEGANGKPYAELTYKIKEVVPKDAHQMVGRFAVKDGTIYDASEKTIVVGVTDEGDGRLSVTYNGKAEFAGVDIANKHETVNVTGVKAWDDGDDQDGKRPESVTVKLLANGEETGQEAVVSAATEWKFSFTNLDKVDEYGNPITYTVAEDTATGYMAPVIIGSIAEGFTITNKHDVEKTSIDVKKVWDDSKNQDGKRPESVQVQLKADGVAVGEAVTLSADNNWKFTWTELDKYKAGKLIKYTVDELNVPAGYTAEVTGDAAQGFTVTNSHANEDTGVSVSKIWSDSNDQDGKRTDSIQVQLKVGDTAIGEPVALNADNDWTYTWKKLDKYADGKVIDYKVEEVSVPDGYEFAISGDATSGFVITNSHEVEKTSVPVIKKWVDDNDRDGLRPESIEVQLKVGDDVKGTATLNDANGWSYVWTNLDKYADGKLIKYTVDEANVPDGYEKQISGTADDGFTVTNTHELATTKVKAEKVWSDDNNRDKLRPESVTLQLMADGEASGDPVVLNADNEWKYTWKDLYQNASGKAIKYTVAEVNVPEGYTPVVTGDAELGFTVTNEHEVGKTSISGVKTWSDDGNRDGLRPASITVRLLADGEEVASQTVTAATDWQYSFKDLPENNEGVKIVYTVTEDEVTGYTAEVNNADLKNKHDIATTTAEVQKLWNDGNDQDGVRPDSVSVQLLANGKAYGDAVELNEGNEWKYAWSDLPKFDNGAEIEYTLAEVALAGDYTSSVARLINNSFVLTNERTTDTTQVDVKKAWSDDGNRDGIRPASVEVQLKANGTALGDPVALNEGNGWKYSWTELAKKADGVDIEYTVEEVNVPEGYGATTAADGTNSFVITNKHDIGTTEISVAKVWEDANDQDGIRPDEVTVQLKADGEAYGDAVVLDASNSWAYTWTGLPAKAAGADIAYTVSELAVPEGYAAVVSGDASKGFTITNAHEVGKTSVSGSKTWADDGNRDGLRPASITVRLLADGVEVDSTTANAESNWQYSFTGLPEKANGKKIAYTVVEDEVVGYAATVEGFDLLNSHETETTSLSVAKIWNDSNDRDGLRPASVSVQLMADGVAQGTPVILNEGNGWSYTWKKLPKKAEGADIVYTVSEPAVVEGYTSEAPVAVEGGFTITNTHESAKTSVAGKKTWNDNDNQDGTRPASITVRLMADGAEVASRVVTADNDWAYSFDGLDKYRDGGIEIAYTVDEDKVAGYVASIDGANITNTLSVGKLVVSKQVEGKDAVGPFGFTVILDDTSVNGVHGDMTFENGVAHVAIEAGRTAEAIDLPVGVTYTVAEDETVGYEASATNATGKIAKGETTTAAFTNTYKATGEAKLFAMKTLVGRTLQGGEFEFTLSGEGIDKQTKTNVGGGRVDFDPIEYTLDDLGEHEYTIREVKGDAPGVTYDESVKTVTVRVSDGGDGVLKVTYDGDDEFAGAQFTNTYKAEGTVELEAAKVLEGKKLAAGEFTFELYEGDELVKTATNDADGKVKFAPIEYTKIGTHAYTIKEVNAGEPGYIYDDSAAEVTVVVTDNGDGTLKAEATYADGAIPTFTNKYGAEGELTIDASKTITGRDFKAGDEFTFTMIADSADAPMPENPQVTIKPTEGTTATIDFGTIHYTFKDVDKTYTYTVAETADVEGVTNDAFNHSVKVSVYNNGDGTLRIVPEYSDGASMTFTNKYAAEGEAQLFAIKTLEGRAMADDEFFFTLTGEGIELHAAARVDADGNGRAEFQPITYTKEDAGKDFTYTITEDKGTLPGITYDESAKTVTVHVADTGDGKLAVTYDGEDTYAGAAFANKYEAQKAKAALGATKVLAGGEISDGQFAFTLRGTSENTADVEQTATNGADGSVAFGEFEYDKPGVYKYEIAEVVPAEAVDNKDGTATLDEITYDSTAHKVVVTVTDDGNGVLVADVAYDGYSNLTITNGAAKLTKTSFEFNKYSFGETGAYDFVVAAANPDGSLRAGSTVEYDAEGNVVDDGSSAFDVRVQNGAFAGSKSEVAFPEIGYAEDGDYYYLAYEDEQDTATMTVDKAQYLIHVTVKDGEVADTTYELIFDGENMGVTDDLSFYNNAAVTLGFNSVSGQAYNSAAERTSIYPEVKKYLNGDTAQLVGNDFQFELIDEATGTVIASATNDENGNVAFFDETVDPGLVYDEPGQYRYIIREVNGGVAGIVYDDSKITLTVNVEQTDEGLAATATYNGPGGAEPAFYNTKEGMDVTVQKVSRSGGEGLAGCTYALWMVGENGDVMVQEAVSDAQGYITFTDVNLIAGQRYYFKEVAAPSGHTVDPYRTAYWTLNDKGDALVLVEDTAADGWHSSAEK